MIGAPTLPVTLEEDHCEGPSGSGITSQSEPAFIDHTVMPSIEVFYTMCGVHVYHCMV